MTGAELTWDSVPLCVSASRPATSACLDCRIGFVALLYEAIMAEVTVSVLQAGALGAKGWHAAEPGELLGSPGFMC